MSSIRTRKFRGDKLRSLRATKDLSQGQLGKKIGAHTTSVSDWERGTNAPSGRHVASLASIFGVDADHFYSAEDDDAEAAQMAPAAAGSLLNLEAIDALLMERIGVAVEKALADAKARHDRV